MKMFTPLHLVDQPEAKKGKKVITFFKQHGDTMLSGVLCTTVLGLMSGQIALLL